MISILGSRIFAFVACVGVVFAASASVSSESASALTHCQRIERQIDDIKAQIRQIQSDPQVGNHEVIRDQMSGLLREESAARAIISRAAVAGTESLETRVAVEAATRTLQDIATRQANLSTQFGRAIRPVAGHLERLQELGRLYGSSGCGPPPSGCSAVSPWLSDLPHMPGQRSPNVRRQAIQLLDDLLVPSDVPVFARVLADGRVVDYVTGVPVVNPAYRDAPVSVDFHPGSPFSAGQAVWVSFYSTQVGGSRISLASFSSSTGQPLVYAPNTARVVTEVPSVWEVFPNGLVVIPTVPAGVGAGAAVRAVQPLGEYILRAPVGVRAVLERLGQLMEGFRAVPSPLSDRRRPSSTNGCHAVFVLGKTKVVGKSCSRNAPFGRWEWKAFSETTERGGGISAKWSESYSRRDGFRPLSGVRVFVHQNTDEEVATWSPEKLGDYRLALPVLAGKYARAFKNWKVQLVTGGRHAGKIVHQVSSRWGGGEAKQIRSTPQAGCDIAPLEGYKERNIPQ